MKIQDRQQTPTVTGAGKHLLAGCSLLSSVYLCSCFRWRAEFPQVERAEPKVYAVPGSGITAEPLTHLDLVSKHYLLFRSLSQAVCAVKGWGIFDDQTQIGGGNWHGQVESTSGLIHWIFGLQLVCRPDVKDFSCHSFNGIPFLFSSIRQKIFASFINCSKSVLTGLRVCGITFDQFQQSLLTCGVFRHSQLSWFPGRFGCPFPVRQNTGVSPVAQHRSAQSSCHGHSPFVFAVCFPQATPIRQCPFSVLMGVHLWE